MIVSIITASFNSERTIRDTIKSVLAQTYPDIEYIIIDGGSKDSTIDIVKEYESKFNGKMHWISEKDKGIYDAMNKGIKISSGEVVGIINSDDYFRTPEIVKHIATIFEENPSIDSTFGDLCYVNPENISKVVRYYSGKHWNPEKFRWGFMPPHPTFYCRKKYFEKFGYYKIDFKIAADFELLIRFLFSNSVNYKYINENMVVMRNGGVSTKDIKSKITLNKEIVRACKENGIYTNFPMLLLKYFVKAFELIGNN